VNPIPLQFILTSEFIEKLFDPVTARVIPAVLSCM
jgi:hypothetical protein